ncbi:MAG TPA: hypothetical protein VGJ48_22505 [Pyrinomonadaceae bacterium]
MPDCLLTSFVFSRERAAAPNKYETRSAVAPDATVNLGDNGIRNHIYKISSVLPWCSQGIKSEVDANGFAQKRVLFPVRASGRLTIAGVFIAGSRNFAKKSVKRTTERVDI